MPRKKKIDTELAQVEVSVPVEAKPKQRRARKKNGNKDRYYFNNDTQLAIVEYQTATSSKRRNELYNTVILKSFEKLVENLINIHKFTSLHDSYDDLKNDCMNFLFETIYKFDATRGSNAFSYFNVVAKNWLIIKTKQKQLKTRNTISMDDPDILTVEDVSKIEEYKILPAQDNTVDNSTIINDIVNVLYEIKKEIRTDNELNCINSIIVIFEDIENIDLLNKNAVMLYMRDISSLSSKQMTASLQNIKKLYRKIKKNNT